MVAARVTTGLAGRVARACIAALFRDKSLPTPRSRYTPRQNSPSTAKIARFGLFWARWAKNFAFATRALPAGRIFSRRPQPTSRAGYPHRYKTLPAHGVHGRNRYKTLPAHGVHELNRYKTLPAHGVHELNRYKTLPASRKTPISALLTRAGRKLSRSRPGRDANNRCRENFLPQWCQCLLSTLSVGQPRHHRFLAACTHPTDAQWARLPKIACNSISGHNRNRLQTLEYQQSFLKA